MTPIKGRSIAKDFVSGEIQSILIFTHQNGIGEGPGTRRVRRLQSGIFRKITRMEPEFGDMANGSIQLYTTTCEITCVVGTKTIYAISNNPYETRGCLLPTESAVNGIVPRKAKSGKLGRDGRIKVRDVKISKEHFEREVTIATTRNPRMSVSVPSHLKGEKEMIERLIALPATSLAKLYI